MDNYLNSEQGKHHKDKYKVATVNGQIRLHKPVTRTTPNTLTIDGQAYTYELTEDGKNTLRDDHRVIDSWMNVTFTHEGRTHDLKNWNLRAIIRFFLTHEQTLTTQHGS